MQSLDGFITVCYRKNARNKTPRHLFNSRSQKWRTVTGRGQKRDDRSCRQSPSSSGCTELPAIRDVRSKLSGSFASQDLQSEVNRKQGIPCKNGTQATVKGPVPRKPSYAEALTRNSTAVARPRAIPNIAQARESLCVENERVLDSTYCANREEDASHSLTLPKHTADKDGIPEEVEAKTVTQEIELGNERVVPTTLRNDAKHTQYDDDPENGFPEDRSHSPKNGGEAVADKALKHSASNTAAPDLVSRAHFSLIGSDSHDCSERPSAKTRGGRLSPKLKDPLLLKKSSAVRSGDSCDSVERPPQGGRGARHTVRADSEAAQPSSADQLGPPERQSRAGFRPRASAGGPEPHGASKDTYVSEGSAKEDKGRAPTQPELPALPARYVSPYLRWDSRKQTHVMWVRNTLLPVAHVHTVGYKYFGKIFYEHYLSPWWPIIVGCTNTFLPCGLVNAGYCRAALVYPCDAQGQATMTGLRAGECAV